MTSASAVAQDKPRAPHALAGAVVGVLAAAVAIGAAQLAAGLTVPQGSPVLAVGQAAIDLTPPPVKDFAISAFGAHDKTVLLGGILVVLALYAAVVGMLAVRRPAERPSSPDPAARQALTTDPDPAGPAGSGRNRRGPGLLLYLSSQSGRS